jgi:hypothetical protein
MCDHLKNTTKIQMLLSMGFNVTVPLIAKVLNDWGITTLSVTSYQPPQVKLTQPKCGQEKPEVRDCPGGHPSG